MSRVTAVRGVGFLAAIVVCAWFALGIHQSRDTAAASALLARPSPLTTASAARAASLLDSAALLNPDQEVGVLRAELAAERGQHVLAQQLALRVAHAEPLNSRGWLLVALLGTPSQRALARQTLGRLVPRVR